LRSLANEGRDADPISQRIRELAKGAADLLEEATHPRPRRPGWLRVQEALSRPLLNLPWAEEFDSSPDPGQWTVNANRGRIEFADGKVWLELKDSTGIDLTTTGVVDFGSRPIVLEARFENRSVAGEWYVGTLLSLDPVVPMEDYLNVRLDNGSQLRMENGETAASGFVKALFDYRPIQTDVPHVMKLYLDAERYRLEIDGALYGEGYHDLPYTCGPLRLWMFSGHKGHGDAWGVDYVRIRPVSIR
jgi:hypothetical protein